MNPLSTSIACLGLALACSAQMNWVERKPSASPEARNCYGMTYDSARQRTVLFGGNTGSKLLADTWEWDGNVWLKFRPKTSPSAREMLAMVYDSARKRTVLFGGSNTSTFADTWEWDGTTWTKLNPVTSPPARRLFAMAYDSTRKRVVLFGGGCDTGFCKLGDTWEWDGTTWTELSPAIAPSARYGPAMAYDRARQRTLLFGGYGPSWSQDTWEWDGTTWTKLNPVTSPPHRYLHAVTYDSARKRTVMFGGSFNRTHFGDMWEWNGATWTQVNTLRAPSVRSCHRITYDSGRGRIVLFGGRDGTTSLRDTWELVPLNAFYSTFGQGCASTALPTSLFATTLPKIGSTFTLSVSNLSPRTAGILLFGTSDQAWNSIPLPLDLAFLGMKGCSLLTSWEMEVGFYSHSGGTWDLPISIPNTTSLEGLTFYNQAWVIDAKANAFGVGTSNGGKGVIGY